MAVIDVMSTETFTGTLALHQLEFASPRVRMNFLLPRCHSPVYLGCHAPCTSIRRSYRMDLSDSITCLVKTIAAWGDVSRRILGICLP
ncbi:hypothetical protein CDAR_368371 [Caerostris darwini]|uniref:Uncharacterized protein n=1 Tax=Caerostris darwini TaxID=1538125 RepID=A0AAV4WFK4_9ARAC|nr:hypothetical protein CDAR_368371 [Caerostris darwini]